MHSRQQGLTAISFLVMAAIAVLIIFAGIRTVPMYMEHIKIVQVLEDVKAEQEGNSPTLATIRTAIGKRLNIEAVTAIDTRAFKIRKTSRGFRVHVKYDASAPYFGNLYLVAKFDDTIEIRN